ncbi:hypothetical protein ACQ4PT_020317 [Festuca glaucescens]
MGNTAPYAVSFLLRFIYGVMQVLLKVAFNQGTSIYVLVFYRHVIATMFLLPIAFAIERKTAPQLSYKVSLKLFVHALYGMSASINISFVGLSYASATSASAVLNLLPVLTFFLALLLGMESLKLKRFHGIVKVSGIVLCAAGVTVLALYQGPKLKSFIHPVFHHASRVDTHPSRSWILGILLQSLATVMFAPWTVFQGPLLVEYPSMLLNTSVQLSLDVGLVAIIYCINKNIFCVQKKYYLQLWSIDKRGPVFVAVTAPLLLSRSFCHFSLEKQSPLEALMVGGLYNVLWGKRMKWLSASSKGVVQKTQRDLISRNKKRVHQFRQRKIRLS